MVNFANFLIQFTSNSTPQPSSSVSLIANYVKTSIPTTFVYMRFIWKSLGVYLSLTWSRNNLRSSSEMELPYQVRQPKRRCSAYTPLIYINFSKLYKSDIDVIRTIRRSRAREMSINVYTLLLCVSYFHSLGVSSLAFLEFGMYINKTRSQSGFDIRQHNLCYFNCIYENSIRYNYIISYIKNSRWNTFFFLQFSWTRNVYASYINNTFCSQDCIHTYTYYIPLGFLLCNCDWCVGDDKM